MYVRRAVSPRPFREMNRRRRQRILARARDQGHRAHIVRDVSRTGPHDLEAELGNPVAELRQVQVLDHDIGDPAIGRHLPGPFDRLDLRVGQLFFAAGIDPKRQIPPGHLVPVRPDPTHAGNLALAKRDREADRIRIAAGRRLRRRALTTPRFGYALLEARRPDHLPRHARTPVHIRDGGALAGSGQAEPIHLSGLHCGRTRAKKFLVDQAAERRAGRAADHRCRDSQQGPAHRRADGRARGR